MIEAYSWCNIYSHLKAVTEPVDTATTGICLAPDTRKNMTCQQTWRPFKMALKSGRPWLS